MHSASVCKAQPGRRGPKSVGCKRPEYRIEQKWCHLQGKEVTSNGGVAEVREATGEGSSASHQEQQLSVGERQSDGGESLGRASRRSSMAEQDSEQARRDADLEAAVLDTLTDSVLTGAADTLIHLHLLHSSPRRMSLQQGGVQ